jgi:hypothetical protein
MQVQPNLSLQTPPSEFPLTVDEAKLYLRIDIDDDDDLIQTLIGAATRRVESYIDQKIIKQKWDIYYDAFPFSEKNIWWDGVRDVAKNILSSAQGYILLPLGKCISIESFKTYDNADNEFEFASSNFNVDNFNSRGRISLKLGQVWPATVLRTINGIKITGFFGLCETAATVPEDIKMALQFIIAQMYEHRGDEYPKIPASALMLLEPYRRVKVGL